MFRLARIHFNHFALAAPNPFRRDQAHRPASRLVTPVATIALGVFLAISGCERSPGEGPLAPQLQSSNPSNLAGGIAETASVTVPVERFCVLIEDDALGSLDALAQDFGLIVLESFGNGRLALLEGAVDEALLADDGRVEMVQRNGLTVMSQPVELTESFYEGFWESGLPKQDALAGLQLDVVHRRLRGRGVRVAVLDTGVDPTHPFLASRVELLPAGSSVLSSVEVASGLDTDGDGIVDEAYGHGTHVAGIIATIAPEATLLPIRVLDSDGVGSAFELAMGLYKAQELGAKIVNLSLVLSGETDVVHVVLRDLSRSGMVVIGAAGNVPGAAFYPASDSHVLSVAASAAQHQVAGFSASDGVRVGAPGVGVLSAYPGGNSAVATGTSMACAVVTGAVASLTQSVRRPTVAVELLRSSATPLDPLKDGDISLLDAMKQIGKSPLGRLHEAQPR